MIFLHRNLVLFFTWTLLLLVSHHNASSQDKAYQLSKSTDIPLLSGGALGTATSLWLRSKNDPYDLARIDQLDMDNLLPLDHSATDNFSEASRLTSDILLTASYTLPLTALIIPEARQNIGAISVMLAESILLNETLTGITKALVKRPRPYTYNPDAPEELRTESNNNLSFFSGHTSYTAMFSFFSAQVLSKHINNPATRKFIWAGAILFPAATAYFRYDAGMHFITDVAAGYVVGAAIGYFIPRLHETALFKNKETSEKAIRLDPEASQMFRLVFVF